jgi:hypothetical protein
MQTVHKGIVSLVLVAMSGSVAYAATIVDTLGTATTSTTFSVFGSGNNVIGAGYEVGPAFTLSSPAVITEMLTVRFGPQLSYTDQGWQRQLD